MVSSTRSGRWWECDMLLLVITVQSYIHFFYNLRHVTPHIHTHTHIRRINRKTLKCRSRFHVACRSKDQPKANHWKNIFSGEKRHATQGFWFGCYAKGHHIVQLLLFPGGANERQRRKLPGVCWVLVWWVFFLPNVWMGFEVELKDPNICRCFFFEGFWEVWWNTVWWVI